MALVDADRTVKLEVIVGYDGSEPAQRALQRAAEVPADRLGHIEVVYVAHAPSSAAMVPGAYGEALAGFDEEEKRLLGLAGETLGGRGLDWSFQRRDGDIATELLAAAEERLDAEQSSRVLLVVGGSSSKIDRLLNSTPARVIRRDDFDVLVVP